ncbi:hypothetical protein D3C72_1094510 [compost metagenome]
MTYERFMTQVYPKMQSYLPGGINYDWHMPIRTRVVLFEQVAKELLAAATELGCDHIGRTDTPHKFNTLIFIERFVNKGCNRNDKKVWRKLCKEAGFVVCNEDWWAPVFWGPMKGWAEFREELQKYASQQKKMTGISN